jgi:Cu/Ag efflux pump CusA
VGVVVIIVVVLTVAVATGAGSEVQRPLATVVIGGLTTTTALTFVPAARGLWRSAAKHELKSKEEAKYRGKQMGSGCSVRPTP